MEVTRRPVKRRSSQTRPKQESLPERVPPSTPPRFGVSSVFAPVSTVSAAAAARLFFQTCAVNRRVGMTPQVRRKRPPKSVDLVLGLWVAGGPKWRPKGPRIVGIRRGVAVAGRPAGRSPTSSDHSEQNASSSASTVRGNEDGQPRGRSKIVFPRGKQQNCRTFPVGMALNKLSCGAQTLINFRDQFQAPQIRKLELFSPQKPNQLLLESTSTRYQHLAWYR